MANQGGLPYTNALSPNVRGAFYEGQGTQPGFIAPTQFSWSVQQQQPPPALQQPQQSSPPQPHTPSHHMTVFPSHPPFPGAAPPQPMHRPAIPPAYHHQQHPQQHHQAQPQPQPQQQQQQQQQQQHLQQQQQQFQQPQQLLQMQRMQQRQPQAVVAGSHMPQPEPPQPQAAGVKRKENKQTGQGAPQLSKQAMGEGLSGDAFDWLNEWGEGTVGGGLQRSQSAGSQGSVSSASVKSGSRKRAGSGAEEGGNKRSKQQQQHQEGSGFADMNGGVSGVPGQGMPQAKPSGDRKRAAPKKKAPSKQQGKAIPPDGLPSPRAVHRPHGVSPHRGGSASVPSGEGGPPAFLPYGPLPPSLNPQDLKNPAFLRVLKSFQRDPAQCLSTQKEGLLMDLARASDLAKGQRQFLEHQISLLDTWKEQAFPAGGHAPRAPTPKHRVASSDSCGGSQATGLEEGNGNEALLFEGNLFDFLDDDDDAIFGGSGGDDLLQLESDVNDISDDGPPAAPPRPMPPPAPPTHSQDSSLSVTSYASASSSSSVSGLLPPSPSSSLSLSLLKHEMAPLPPTPLPSGSVDGSVMVQIKVRIRCDSLGPMKKKERTLWANVRVPESEASLMQAPIICTSKSGSKKKHSNPRPAGASGELGPSASFTGGVPGAKPPKGQRKQKRKGSVGSDAAPEAVGPPSSSSAVVVVEMPEMPFYDPLDTYADFEASTAQLWEYVEEGGWLRPLLQALGNVASMSAAEKALDDLLPFEEAPKGRDPTSACLSDDFDALLHDTTARVSLENVSGWDAQADHCPSLSDLFPSCPAPPRRLDHSKLAVRLLSALVHVPSTRLPSSTHSSLTRPPPEDDEEEEEEEEEGQHMEVEKDGSSVSSPPLLSDSAPMPPQAATPPQSPPPSPSRTCTEPPSSKPSTVPCPSSPSPPSLPPSPSSPHSPPPSPPNPPRSPQAPTAALSPRPCSKRQLEDKGRGAPLTVTTSSAPAPPSHEPKPPRPMAALQEDDKAPPRASCGVSLRDGWNSRILEEMDGLGLWDAGDKDRLREALSCAEEEDEEGEASCPAWALGRVEREGLETGMWVREAERRLQQLSRDNNVRIARLRASVLQAVRREIEEERAQWAADQAIVDKWEKLQAAKKKEDERQKAAQEAAKEAQRLHDLQQQQLQQQQQQAEREREAAQQAQMLANIAAMVAPPPAPMHVHPIMGGGPQDRYMGGYGPTAVSKPAPPAFAPQPHLYVAVPPPAPHLPPPQALTPLLPLPMANGLMEVDPLLLEGPAGDGYEHAALYETIAALEDAPMPMPQTPAQHMPYFNMFPNFNDGQQMGGAQDHGAFFVAADNLLPPST